MCARRLACVFLRISASFDASAPHFLASALKKQFALSNAQLGFLYAAHAAPDIVSPLIGALLIRQFGPQSVLMIASAVAVAGAALQARHSDPAAGGRKICHAYPFPLRQISLKLLFTATHISSTFH